MAMVEAAQNVHPPVQPLHPQPMPAAVRRLFNLSDDGCDFRPDRRASDDPILVAGRYKAVLRIADQPLVLAADSGSARLAAGAHAKYVGRTHWAELTLEP